MRNWNHFPYSAAEEVYVNPQSSEAGLTGLKWDGDNDVAYSTLQNAIDTITDHTALEIYLANHEGDGLIKGAGSIAMADWDGHEIHAYVNGTNYYNSYARQPLIFDGTIHPGGDFSATGGQLITFESNTSIPAAAEECFLTQPELVTLTNGGDTLLTEQASIAAVEANPGSWWIDVGSAPDKLYVSLPDSATDYFTNGGAVALQTNGVAQTISVAFGNILIIENCTIWGKILCQFGGLIVLYNCDSWFSNDSGIRISSGGTLTGEDIRIHHAYTDGLSLHGGRCNIKNLLVNKVGTGVIDQCLTLHEKAAATIEGAILNDASAEVVAIVGGSTLNLKDFVVSGGTKGIRIDDESGGHIRDGLIHTCTTGFSLDPRSGAVPYFNYNHRVDLRNVGFGNNTTDISASATSSTTVTLNDCSYKTVDGANTNFTVINSPKDIAKAKSFNKATQSKDNGNLTIFEPDGTTEMGTFTFTETESDITRDFA